MIFFRATSASAHFCACIAVCASVTSAFKLATVAFSALIATACSLADRDASAPAPAMPPLASGLERSIMRELLPSTNWARLVYKTPTLGSITSTVYASGTMPRETYSPFLSVLVLYCLLVWGLVKTTCRLGAGAFSCVTLPVIMSECAPPDIAASCGQAVTAPIRKKEDSDQNYGSVAFGMSNRTGWVGVLRRLSPEQNGCAQPVPWLTSSWSYRWFPPSNRCIPAWPSH